MHVVGLVFRSAPSQPQMRTLGIKIERGYEKIFITALLIASSGLAFAGEPYYLVQRGIEDSSVVTVYGYPDNKTPCIFLEKFMNKTMEEERNYHRYSCVDSTTAMITDCKGEKDKGYNCVENWTIRNSLLKELNIK